MMLVDLQKIRRDLHQIPELGFQEYKTQKYLLDYIRSIATERVEVKTWKTGILVKVTGTNSKRLIGYRTDIDGLPIHEELESDYVSSISGNMHACGHDFHMTIALGALKNIIDNPIQDDVLFVFQPAEEGPGGAFPLMQSDVFQQWYPDCIFALHIAPEYSVGTVATKPGLLFANTSELYIDFNGKGGHAAYPHLTKDMAVAAGAFIAAVQGIVARNLDPLDSAVITIGKMTSGHVQNAIAETARLEGTIRTLNPTIVTYVKEKLERLAEGFEIMYDCQITLDYGSSYYQVYNHDNFVQQFKDVVSKMGVHFVEAKEAMTGEDFGYMLKDIPGFMFWLGVDSPYGLHHAKLNPKEEALEVGVKVVTQMLQELSNGGN
jgi:N-acetyldiaminopimelate deacetylase